MEPLYRYYIATLTQECPEFVAHNRALFALRAPVLDVVDVSRSRDDDEDDEVTNVVHAWRETNAADLGKAAAEAREWQVAEVRKRPGYPPYNRVVVGRSGVCDLVVPFAAVSKLHAHFHVEGPRTVAIEDRGSRNGTQLNGVALEPMRPVPVRPGDILHLGGVEVRLMDAAALHSFLRSLQPPS